MTRKDYIAIAKSFKKAKDAANSATSIKMLAEDLCAVFVQDNPAFDSKRFLAACGF